MRTSKELWKTFVLEGMNHDKIEPVIRESWKRSISYGLNPRELGKRVVYSKMELKNALKKNESLIEIAASYGENIFNILNDMDGVLICILDRNCHILKIWGDGYLDQQYKDWGIGVGVCCKEEYMGTNGAGTTFHMNKPVLIDGYEHFAEKLHDRTCLSVPIHNPSGEMSAIFNISIPADRFNKNLWGMVMAAAQGIERELHHIEYTEKIEELNKRLEEKLKEERRLKREIKEKAKLLEAVIDNMSDGLMIYDGDGRRIVANESIKKLNRMDKYRAGYGRDDGIPKFLNYKYVNGEVIPRDRYSINRILMGERVEKEIFVAEGENYKKYMMINGFPILDDDGKIKYGVIKYTDVTKIEQQEMESRKGREFISKILDILGTPMVVVSYPELIYEISNHKNNELFRRLIGDKIPDLNLVGMRVEEAGELLGNQDFMEKVIQVAQSGKEVFLESYPYHRINAYYHCVYSPLFNEEGKVTHVALISLDVTDQVTYQRKMEEISKQKEEFFSIVSHELRSPAAVINLATQMLLSDYYSKELSSSSKKLVGKIKQNSYRLLRLINNFLDMTKIEEGFVNINYTNVDVVKLSKAIMDSLRLFAMNKSIDLKFSTKLKEKVIAVDTDKYERILLNLLSNAFKFTPEDREISLCIEEIKGYVKVCVHDQGIGIPKDKLDTIFNRFVQVDSSLSRKSEGTGIGLSLVKALIEKMDGKLKVTSVLGEGSTFVIYLPDRIFEDDGILESAMKSYGEMAEVINIEFSDIYAE